MWYSYYKVWDHLLFITGIPILARRRICTETAPWCKRNKYVIIDYGFINRVNIGLRWWLVAYSAPSQCWVIVHWTARNKLQWNFNQIRTLSLTKMRLKTSSAKWRPFCAGGEQLTAFAQRWYEFNVWYIKPINTETIEQYHTWLTALWHWITWRAIIEVNSMCVRYITQIHSSRQNGFSWKHIKYWNVFQFADGVYANPYRDDYWSWYRVYHTMKIITKSGVMCIIIFLFFPV